MATGLLGIGLVITCLAGFRLLLLAVDLISGAREQRRIRGAELVMIALTVFGVVCLVVGLLQLHAQGK
jgi:uncharacterized membrane protein